MYMKNNLSETVRIPRGNPDPAYLTLYHPLFSHRRTACLKDGSSIQIRPSNSEDVPALQRFFETLSDESMYFRFGRCSTAVNQDFLSRLCQVDNYRDYTFLSIVRDEETIVGEAQLNRLADYESAEFSFIVSDRWQGKGIGSLLMDFCLAIANDLGMKTIMMEIMKTNRRMKYFCNKYGFQQLPNTCADDTEEVLQLKIGRNSAPGDFLFVF